MSRPQRVQLFHRSARGIAIVYATVILVAFIGLISLTVDYGRVQLAKAQLQNATEAAARYGVTGLSDGTAVSKAQTVAAQNKVDGTTLALLTSDVESGRWNTITRSFTVNGTPANALRVSGRRIASRSTAVPLSFAQFFGIKTCNVTSQSVAMRSVLPYSMVALDGVTMSGTSRLRRRSGESGTVIVASNGAWSLGASTQILGDVLYRGSVPSGGTISGDKDLMSANIAYPTITAPGGTWNVGAVNITSGFYGGLSGNIAATNVNISGNATFQITGDLNVYVSGSFNFGGNCTIDTGGFNYKLTFYLSNSSTITFTNNNALNVIVYGPTSTMVVNAPGTITGSFVCRTLNMSQGTIEYTDALIIPQQPTGGGAAVVAGDVVTVK